MFKRKKRPVFNYNKIDLVIIPSRSQMSKYKGQLDKLESINELNKSNRFSRTAKS